MLRPLLRSKVHRVRVTEANLDFRGSITIDPTPMDTAQIAPLEKVDIYNGHRFSTYALPAAADSGEIRIHVAAARQTGPEELLIIGCYGQLAEQEVDAHRAEIVHVDRDRGISDTVQVFARALDEFVG